MNTARVEKATGRNAISPTTPPQSPSAQWRKGWTPWGTPCSVLIVDGYAHAAHAAEKHDCPLARMVEQASGFAETTEVKKTQEMGAGRYLKKPLTMEILGIAIQEELSAK